MQAKDNLQHVEAIACSSQSTIASSSIAKTPSTTKQRLVFDGVVITVPYSCSDMHPKTTRVESPYPSRPPAPESIDDRTTPSTLGEPYGVRAHTKGQLHKLRRREETETNLDAPSGSTSWRPSRRVRRCITDEQTIDRLLQAQWAPGVIAPEYARRIRIPRPSVLAENLHFISPSATRPRHPDTRRSWTSYSMPRWSRIATFKERLDTRLGPGDFNRALYGHPKPVS